MYPSPLRMRAISTFMREVGISARSCSAWLALRMRVSMSAIGSVSIVSLLPGALGHAGDDALVGELPQADPAEPELLVDRARAAAPAATRVGARLVLRRALPLRDQGLLCHLGLLPSRGEREAELAQQRQPRLVRLRGGRDRHVEAPDLVDRVVVDLREDDLLADAERVVAAAVERIGRQASEVAYARQGNRDEPVEELVHPVAAQRHLDADGHTLAQLEARD